MSAKPKVADLSDAVQDYLREIYKLQAESGHVKTSTLAQRMGVAPPSATAMMKKLASHGLVDHQLYRGVRLTRTGERIALELLRHHRLLELYLARTLDLELDAVHADPRPARRSDPGRKAQDHQIEIEATHRTGAGGGSDGATRP
jgi:Mn-dependent DtxR family transcriptional regulator